MKTSTVAGAVGGAFLGMGVIAALPILGPVGSISALGAVLGLSLGGTGGAMAVQHLEEREETLQQSAFEEGQARGQAENLARLQRVQQAVRRFHGWWGGYRQRVEALMALGLACVAVDGEVSDDARAFVAQFVWGVTGRWQHWGLRRRMAVLAEHPPTFDEALEALEALQDPALDEIVPEMIDVAIHADGAPSRAQRKLRSRWRSRRGAEIKERAR
ncbi:MAG: hypothetical protein KTR31_41770 [Myxococcales bacterium]|nr:hypothetical protein [Myxococcales bacterium]